MRPIPGYEGLYSATSDGHIWSHKNQRIRKEYLDSSGYLSVTLSRNGEKKTVQVHRLVASAWLGERPIGCDVNHIDGIKRNNQPRNLEHISRKENVKHAIRMGLMTPSQTRLKHIGISQRKLSVEQAREIQRLYADGHLQKHLSEQFGVSKTTIRNIINGLRYQASIE